LHLVLEPGCRLLPASLPLVQLLLLELVLQLLLNFVRVIRIAFPFDLRQQMFLIFQEKGVFEHLVRRALPLRLVEVVHVQLSDKR
jgi:hypothetical protein